MNISSRDHEPSITAVTKGRTCKTCRWVANAEEDGGRYAKCDAPQNFIKKRVVTGFEDTTPTRRLDYCDSVRLFRAGLFSNRCGTNGRWWKAALSSAKPAVDDSSRDDQIPHPITAKGLS